LTKSPARNLCLLLLLALLAVGCDAQPITLTDVFPGADALPDWTPAGEVAVYDRETIYDLVNGQAESFFVYGFEQVAVCSYENAAGNVLRATVWQLATPADAYGLFTASISGEPAAIGPSTGSGLGNDGDADPGRRLAFWQDRYYVHVHARQKVPDTELQNLAKAISANLPSGGERPALLDRLPPDGLVARRTIFFHEEISIQSDIWLGGENVLGLGPETNGVLARYEIGGAKGYLLLVQYPGAEAASVGLKALRPDQVDDLVVADARGNLLGAVFGEIDQGAAMKLLEEALK
jgi:hypothetical protein